MDQWKSDLIATITGSPAYPSNDGRQHRAILDHLARYSAPEYREYRTEDYLRQTFFDARYGGKVSMYVKRIAGALERYFASEEGKQHPYRIEIIRGLNIDPDDRYALRFSQNQGALPRLFWQPYLEERVSTLIAYGVPLFVRNGAQTTFTRCADVNVPSDVKRKRPSDEICWPFVAHGDLLAAIALHRWLTDQRLRVDLKAFKADSKLSALPDLTSNDSNVIALGSIRVNGLLDEYQRHTLPKGSTRKYLPFRLRLYDVVQIDDREQQVGAPSQEGHTASMSSVPVIITRREGAIRGVITLIASNHGRAVQRICQVLTNSGDIDELFRDPRLQNWPSRMPTHFQILLKVDVFTDEDMGTSFSVEDVWSWSAGE